jgi:phage shock protein A
MLNQKKFIEQFELVVKQEIKNYQDERSALNQAINSLRKDLQDHVEDSNLRFAKLESFSSKFDSQLKQFKGEMDKLFYQISSYEKNIQKSIEEVSERIKPLIQKVQDLSKDHLSLETRVTANTGFIVQNKKDIAYLKTDLGRKEFLIYERIKKETQWSIDYILNLPSEALEVKEELKKELDVTNLNFSGFKQTLDSHRKSLYVLEKNIENIYTQIERSKV